MATKNANKVMAGMGLAALAAAAAGAAYLYGTEAGKKRRKEIKGWMLRMRGDVIDRMEKMKDWSETAYNKVVEEVAQKYKNVKNVSPGEVAAVVQELRGHWKNIKRQVESAHKKPAKKRTTKKKSS
jgi:gas vesicle protein